MPQRVSSRRSRGGIAQAKPWHQTPDLRQSHLRPRTSDPTSDRHATAVLEQVCKQIWHAMPCHATSPTMPRHESSHVMPRATAVSAPPDTAAPPTTTLLPLLPCAHHCCTSTTTRSPLLQHRPRKVERLLRDQHAVALGHEHLHRGPGRIGVGCGAELGVRGQGCKRSGPRSQVNMAASKSSS